MSTSRSDPFHGRGLRAALPALVLALGSLTGCSALGSDDDEPAPATQATAVPADVLDALQRTLDKRAAAVRHQDHARFMAGVGRERPGFTRNQETYFDNLAQLPLAGFAYSFDARQMVRVGDDYWVVVDVSMKLDGYDDLPVVAPDRYRFTPSPKRPGVFLLASVTDAAWESRNQVRPQPWDAGPIDVRTGVGVLGIFDPASVSAAGDLVGSVQRGISAVSGVVPYQWSRSVVVYALSDPAFLTGLDGLPGDDPEALDGVAFPVLSTPDGGPLAATRFVLNPRMLGEPGPDRDRLIRHELTHVAIGERDDDAPVWLSEGLAEYVSVQPLDPADRHIAGAAIAAAKSGVADLPADDTFNDGDSEAHYGLSWWACEYVARSYGASLLWTLLDLLDQPGSTEAEQDVVLEEMLGIGRRELARRAARLLVVTFDPGSLAPPEPTQTPTPTETPSPDSSDG